MSFLDYLKEHRGLFIDHRTSIPTHQGLTAQEAEERAHESSTTAAGSVSGGGSGGSPGEPVRTRRRRQSADPRNIQFRHIRPAFAPSPYSDPLPYEEPWERAFR